MAQIKFFKGSSQSSIPVKKHDGNIYVVQNNGINTGDIFVDISNSQRLKISPEAVPECRTTAQWKANNYDIQTVSTFGKIYIYSDYRTETIDSELINIPGYKIGDGLAYIADLPIYEGVTAEEKDFWNHKVDAFMSTQVGQEETLILSYGLS